MSPITSTVLVSLFNEKGNYSLLFTERSKNLKHHPGEISFPGGRIEENENSMDAVKRETKEEINADIIKIIDVLSPVKTYVSDHTILPYIGLLETNHIILNRNEVEKIHTVSFDTFMNTAMIPKRFIYNNEYITYPAWDFGSFFVWGATGRILFLFKEWAKRKDSFNGTSVL